MSDLTDSQIMQEFKRQTYLCSGLGLVRMLSIVYQQFGKRMPERAEILQSRLASAESVIEDLKSKCLEHEQRWARIAKKCREMHDVPCFCECHIFSTDIDWYERNPK